MTLHPCWVRRCENAPERASQRCQPQCCPKSRYQSANFSKGTRQTPFLSFSHEHAILRKLVENPPQDHPNVIPCIPARWDFVRALRNTLPGDTILRAAPNPCMRVQPSRHQPVTNDHQDSHENDSPRQRVLAAPHERADIVPCTPAG